MPTTPKAKAPARSKAEIAQAKYDTQAAIVAKARARITKAESNLTEAQGALPEAEARLTYLATDPDLPEQPGSAKVEAPTATGIVTGEESGVADVTAFGGKPQAHGDDGTSDTDSHVAGH